SHRNVPEAEKLHLWAEKNPSKAAAWAGNLDRDDPMYALALPNVADVWARMDLESATDWVLAQETSVARDEALASCCRVAIRADSPRAETLLSQIESEELRNRLMAKRLTREIDSGVPVERVIGDMRIDPEVEAMVQVHVETRAAWGAWIDRFARSAGRE
ncbi:MAG: hypothetical protein AAF514_17055, partial [Verrucomicrobiota bacterium]